MSTERKTPSGHGPSTLCVHAGTYIDQMTGGVCTPVFASSSYAFPNVRNQTSYPRDFNTPNQRVIEHKLAALEQGEAAVTFGSGMAAISTVLFAHLNPGDHAIVQNDLYGGTVLFLQELARLGILVSQARTTEDFESEMRPETKVIFIESPSNPLLHVVEIPAISRIGHKHGVTVIIDNTFATPINQNPLQLGVDIVIHSATKYLNGHSDLNAGVVVSSSKNIERIRECAVNHGGLLDAHACYLLERGLKTLALRVKTHNENAMRLAQFLAQHPAVAKVNYPGLATHPNHALASQQMRGFGGMLSFELRDPARVDSVLSGFRVVTPALSLGGVESLVCIPSRTSHRKMSPSERHAAGISEGLIRVSVGIEDIEDLLADFDQSLRGATK